MNYIKVSDAVDELSLSRRDNDRTDWLRYLVLSKSVARDLKIKFLNDFRRVWLPINPSTNSVRLPFDNMRFRSISVEEKCRDIFGKETSKVIPLTLNPYINITPQEPITCNNSCNCEIAHPVCVELANYEMICEEVSVDPNASPPITGQRQTILRTCPNGDIIKEVTEPVQVWVKGEQQCDYQISIARSPYNICSYVYLLSQLDPGLPVVIKMNLNGEIITSESMSTIAEINAWFESYGWTVDANEEYSIAETSDIWGMQVIVIEQGNGAINETTLERNCVESTTIAFPYTITSYVLNGATVTLSPPEEIETQQDQDDFFASLGFTKVDNTHYTIEGTTDVYFSLLIETSDSVPEQLMLNFIQVIGSCERPFISTGYENKLFKDILCNVTLKECGCIEESVSNISTIVQCCSPLLHCCHVGQLTDWSGWSYVPGCCKTNSEQPYNRFGTYNIDEKNFILYLDSVNATRVLLAYDSDGICDGEYYLPDYTIRSLKAGIAWYSAQYDEDVTSQRRRELEINYIKELNDLQATYTDPIRMADLINALKTRKYPY